MSGNNFVTKHLLRRRVSEHRPYDEDHDNNGNSSSSSSSSDEDEGRNRGGKGRTDGREKYKKDKKDKHNKKDKKDKNEKAEWVQAQDPVGRLCWQNRKTGQVTYGNNISAPQQGFNPNLTGEPAYGAAPAAAVPIGPPGYMVPPGPYVPPPVGGYGRSPVAMYQAPPWNAGGAGPAMPVAVPEYVKKQIHAEKKRKEEESRKKLEKTGTWQRHYSSEGTKYWQNTASGRKLPMDPYK